MQKKLYCVTFHDGEADFGVYFTTYNEAQDYRNHLFDAILDDDGEPMFDPNEDADVIEVVEVDSANGCKVYNTVGEAILDGADEL